MNLTPEMARRNAAVRSIDEAITKLVLTDGIGAAFSAFAISAIHFAGNSSDSNACVLGLLKSILDTHNIALIVQNSQGETRQ